MVHSEESDHCVGPAFCKRPHYMPLGLFVPHDYFRTGVRSPGGQVLPKTSAKTTPNAPMSGSDCPNGMCSRKPTGAAAETYGKPAAGKLEAAVFALG